MPKQDKEKAQNGIFAFSMMLASLAQNKRETRFCVVRFSNAFFDKPHRFTMNFRKSMI